MLFGINTPVVFSGVLSHPSMMSLSFYVCSQIKRCWGETTWQRDGGSDADASRLLKWKKKQQPKIQTKRKNKNKQKTLSPYLLSVVEEEECGISSYAVFRANLIVLSAVHLSHDNMSMLLNRNVIVNFDPVNLLKGCLFNNLICQPVSYDQHPALSNR